MSCYEIEALRLGLMNVLGTEDRNAREHAEKELDGHLDGPVEALANAETLSGIERHLDAALVELEEEIAATDTDDPEYDYLRGRLVAVRDAEQAVHRLTQQGESILGGLGEAHDVLHETFPVDE
jgi:septation ring formation regulator EzrA